MDTQPQKQKVSGRMLKLNGRSIFFDVYTAKNNSQYLKVTESRFDKTTKQTKRNSLILFKEDLEKFKSELNNVNID